MTTPRCEGADLSVCAPQPLPAGVPWDFATLACRTHDPLAGYLCACEDGAACLCDEYEGAAGYVRLGALYRGRGVCRDGVTL